MKVILLEDVKGLGKKGELVNAKTGYARNFLFPNKKALEGTKENIEKWEEDVRMQQENKKEAQAAAENQKAELEKTSVELKMKSGEGGRLFGSITSQDIADALEKKGHKIDKKKIELKNPIKELGNFTVPVRVYPEIVAQVPVVVKEA